MLREKRYGKFLLKGNLLSRLLKPVELSHEWVSENFKYHEPEFYARFFDEAEEGLFECYTCHTMIDVIRKPVTCDTKFCDL